MSKGLSNSCWSLKTCSNRLTELGRLAAVDGSLINAALSMDWAEYRKGVKRAKPHIDLSHQR